ncbi:arginine--tRNA ligase [Rubrivirga marina]|uniref:Arginine--tRNA ligase n=1 Tax=Rubrivirga marina TaxID=1196024 RepID=A0A271J5S9_9BACT|nr:arginine--tRNA ligase [Rubrivirga marina]PAP78434.1 arginine--tRNA ligase [Rubrivirga marina]
MEDTLAAAVRAALAALPDLPDDFDAEAVEVEFQTPNDPSHGDLATNVALQLARPLRRSPRAIAEGVAERIEVDPTRVAAVEVAGPGFLNVRFASAHLTAGLAELLEQGADYGRVADHDGETAIVEYVSANPTGPLTVGHGRNAVLGDTIANLLDWTGYKVTREYYFNDAGRQMRVLGQSVRARYEAVVRPGGPTKTLEDGLEVPASFPDDGYRGEYITDVAQALADAHGDALLDAPDEAPFKEAAEQAVFAEIMATLKRLGVEMDSTFNERTLYEGDPAPVWDVVETLKANDLAYEEDGAVWFRTSALGKTDSRDGDEEGKDTVLVKSSGEPTYRLPDIAYHLDKLSRADLVLDVFGADHIATYPDVLRGVTALGGDADAIEVVVYQFVTLVRGGQPVKMSTRKATYETLDDLMSEVGEDVTRFFFLMRAPGTHLEFDLDLAKEASEKNPVFYLQYAHARIASIERKAEETGLDASGDADLSVLSHESEEALVKTLLQFPDEVRTAADARAPHKLATFLRDVATAFNAFYRDCRIVGEETELATARLKLARATRTVLKNGLTILGVTAPEQM